MYMLKNLKANNLNRRTVQIVGQKEERVLVKFIGTQNIFSVQWSSLEKWIGPSLEVAARAAQKLGFRVVE